MSFPKLHQNVCAVTVTYGNRSSFVDKLLERLKEVGVAKVVVVDNGSVAASVEALRAMSVRWKSFMVLLELGVNTGSAGGFKNGIVMAERQQDCEFIWLLDDDNLPAADALQRLIEAYPKDESLCSLLSLRKDRNYRKVRNDQDVKRKFRCNNSFLDYSLRNWFRRKVMYNIMREKFDVVSIPYAPYGGMFVPSKLLSIIGYPNEEMFLYMDDHEFSRRITIMGYKIFLVRKSIVEDVDQSWHVQKKYTFLKRFRAMADNDDQRMYYIIRNSAFLERKYFITNAIEYAINRFLFSILFFSVCVFKGKKDKIAIFKKALTDAELMK